jgi:hypothetical protein
MQKGQPPAQFFNGQRSDIGVYFFVHSFSFWLLVSIPKYIVTIGGGQPIIEIFILDNLDWLKKIGVQQDGSSER